MNINEILDCKKKIDAIGGVVTLSDFATLLGVSDAQEINYLARQYIKAGIVKRYCNGFYITDSYSPEFLCQKIYPESYLSLTTVLAKELVTGSVPKKTIYAVKLGRNRIFDNGELKIVYFSIKKELFFAWKIVNGVRYASKEKALVDLLYYFQKGFKPSVNIYSDLFLDRINRNEIRNILKKYKNNKFKAFVRGLLEQYADQE